MYWFHQSVHVYHRRGKIQPIIVYNYDSPKSTAPQHQYLKEVNPASWYTSHRTFQTSKIKIYEIYFIKGT